MAFQPLGYRFDIRSPKSSAVVKAALRKKKKGWMEAKSGPRGWIVGPILCLWSSAFDSYGPMVIARIKEDGQGSRIVGRAGSDLNGSLAFLLLTPPMGWLVWQIVKDGAATWGLLAVVAVVFGLGLPVTLWVHHLDRRDADGLVRFIKRSIGIEEPRRSKNRHPRLNDDQPVLGARFSIDGDEVGAGPSPRMLADAVARLEPHSFIILEFGPENYVQAAKNYDRFALEKRGGDKGRHFRAIGELPEEEVVDAMIAYLTGEPHNDRLRWEKITI